MTGSGKERGGCQKGRDALAGPEGLHGWAGSEEGGGTRKEKRL